MPEDSGSSVDVSTGEGASAGNALEPTGMATTRDGVGVASYDLGGKGQPLLLAHATGFCAAVLAPLARALRTQFHCFALDFRAHGRSEQPPDGNFDWHGFGADVLAVVDELGLDKPVAFGHSCGGAALLLAEEQRPGTFAALFCYEPVVYPGDPPLPPSFEGNPMSEVALRRRTSFASRAEALSNFSSKPPFDRLRADVLAAYVENGFDQTPDGISLRCRREDEAAIYANGFSHDAFGRFPEVVCDVKLAGGSETDAFGIDLITALAGRLPRSSTLVVPGLGHFGPMEDPDALARELSSYFDSCSLPAQPGDGCNPRAQS